MTVHTCVGFMFYMGGKSRFYVAAHVLAPSLRAPTPILLTTDYLHMCPFITKCLLCTSVTIHTLNNVLRIS